MPTISATHATLRFRGDDLDPDDLTARLGARPDLSARKGEVIVSTRPGPKSVAETGRWSLGVEPREPGDLDAQITQLFGLLTSDLDVWRDLAARYDPNLFVGLFMREFNEGFAISPDCLVMLGERGVRLDLDVYGSEHDPDGLLKGTVAVIESLRASELIDARIAELGDWRGAMLARVRALIRDADPDVVEEWKWRGVPVWSHAGILCTGETYKAVVKLTFARGAALEDPARLFNASLDGGARRAIDLREGEALDAEPFQALIRAAVALNVAAGAARRRKRPDPLAAVPGRGETR